MMVLIQHGQNIQNMSDCKHKIILNSVQLMRDKLNLTPALLFTCVKRTYTDLSSSFCFSPVVTGATDGIGKSYAEEVRLLDPYLFHFFQGKAMTHAHTHTHTMFTHRPRQGSSYRPINVYKSPRTHIQYTHTLQGRLTNKSSYRGNKHTLNRGYPATCLARTSVGVLAV